MAYAYGYQPQGYMEQRSAVDPNAVFEQQQQAAQAAHERSLQNQEQQRRMYDSQSDRIGQRQKFGVLGGLLSGGGYGGMRSMTRRFGDTPSSERPNVSYGTGYNAGGRLLGGLSQKPSVAAFGKGRAMSSAAGLGMKQATDDQQMSVDQMQEDSRQRMQQASNSASRASNETQQRIQEGNLANRRSTFDTGMAYDFAQQQKRRAMDFRQMLFNGLTKDF